MISNKQKKILFEKINSLSKTEHEEIYKILSLNNENKVSFSKNRNGIFFNLSEIDDCLYEKIESFVTFCITNKKDLDEYDKIINECKINNNYNVLQNINEQTNSQDGANDKYNEDWNTVVSQPKSVQRVSSYIERLMNERDNTCKKKINIKFNTAKKKFSKKFVCDKKIDLENANLMEEAYILI